MSDCCLKWAAITHTMAEQGTKVELYVYDLTNGLASLLSPSILGKHLKSFIWIQLNRMNNSRPWPAVSFMVGFIILVSMFNLK